MSLPAATEEAARLRGEAASQLIKTGLIHSEIKRSLNKLYIDLERNPPEHCVKFRDTSMEVFVQAFEGTASLLLETKRNLQTVAGASAASLSTTGASTEIKAVEENLQEITVKLDRLSKRINHLMKLEDGNDNYLDIFERGGAHGLMDSIHSSLEDALDSLMKLVMGG